MRESNLYLYRSVYPARVDWKKGRVVAVPPRRVEDDGYGNWILPPDERLPRGLSSKFANLREAQGKSYKADFESFVGQFGLLGVTGLPKGPFEPPMYGESWEEEIDWWLYYASEVYRLLRLYRIIRKARTDRNYDAEGALQELLLFEQVYQVRHTGKLKDDGRYAWTEHKQETPFIRAAWKKNGAETGQMFEETMPPLEGAAYILASTISRNLAGGVIIEMGKIAPSKESPIGYAIAEQRCTKYLLAGIFHDLWELITGDQPIKVCAYSACTNFFIPQRRTKDYCSKACNQAAYRERKRTATVTA